MWSSLLAKLFEFLLQWAPGLAGFIAGKKIEEGKQDKERLKNAEETARTFADMPVTPDDAVIKLRDRIKNKLGKT